MPICVVIPSFNRPAQLERSINSVLNQTSTDYSLIVVDDASDCDLSSCRELVESSGHYWLTLDKNVGPAEARNKGAGLGSFDWVMFLDSDDVWMADKIEIQMQWHQANPECRISQVQEKWIRNGQAFEKPVHLQQPGGEIFSECVSRCAIGPSCVAIRNDLWQETGGFDPWFRVCEDYELWLRIACRESVGLVEGGELIEKHGGHADQLSTAVPALDRFRLVALAKLLSESQLSDDQKKAVVEQLEKKRTVLAKGAQKRDRHDWAEFFTELSFPLSDTDFSRARQYCID